MTEPLDLKVLRQKLKLSQPELAKRAGVNVSTVWRWENEGVPENGPARAFLDQLARQAKEAAAPAQTEATT